MSNENKHLSKDIARLLYHVVPRHLSSFAELSRSHNMLFVLGEGGMEIGSFLTEKYSFSFGALQKVA